MADRSEFQIAPSGLAYSALHCPPPSAFSPRSRAMPRPVTARPSKRLAAFQTICSVIQPGLCRTVASIPSRITEYCRQPNGHKCRRPAALGRHFTRTGFREAAYCGRRRRRGKQGACDSCTLEASTGCFSAWSNLHPLDNKTSGVLLRFECDRGNQIFRVRETLGLSDIAVFCP